jgi:putative flavoprotein involved in K+ transport
LGGQEQPGLLRHAVEAALAGRGELVLITGDPRIGKTAVASKAADHAVSLRARTVIADEDVVVVGGGPAGLAAAAELSRAGLDPLVLSAATRPGDIWRGHYERLHLHTVRHLSHLPGQYLPRRYGTWVAKDAVGDYLDEYATNHIPRLHANTPVSRVEPFGDEWSLDLPDGRVRARVVVIATGVNRAARRLDLPGQDTFTGQVMHSSDYRHGRALAGKRVLVVGAGNSGAEIATDLVEHGASKVIVAVRTAPTIVPRAVLGVPVQALGAVIEHLPNRAADYLVGVLSGLTVGDLSAHGLPRPTRGGVSRARDDNVTLTIDVGFVAGLRTGQITAVGAALSFVPDGVVVQGGCVITVDTVIAATGFRTELEELLHTPVPVLDAKGWPVEAQPLPGLWFHGFVNEPGGNLRHFRRHARPLARAVANHLAHFPN